MTTAAKTPCRLCGNPELSLLMDLGRQPIAHRFLEQPEEEFKHPLTLHYCEQCGLGQICDPVSPEILYKGYNYCFSEWKPEPHRETELDLICAHKQNAKIFEIGCNDGLFLEQLQLRGQQVCVGLEPNSFAKKFATEQRGLHVYETFLDEDTCNDALAKFGKFDLVMARQVLEHVPGIELFFKCVNMLLKDDGMVFIDVPDVGPGLKVGDCTIAWEEHVNYFTDNVLNNLLDRHGFTPVEEKKFNYSGGTLAVLARRKTARDVFVPSHDYLPFSRTFSERVQHYGARLSQALTLAKKSFDQVVIYGVGCRACALVNGHNLGGVIDFAVDDQMERQGKLMPGSQLEIKSPEVLQKPGAKSLVILAVNQENEAGVSAKTLAACPESHVTFLIVMGPTNIEQELDAFIAGIQS
ncbi:MAG TPA: D-mycarose 3-C-methyltransferase [Verrucomicrobiales bacterium]|nr:D-mycarose 3-C-methyltransferase [Verrucomicrobiales bacterium]